MTNYIAAEDLKKSLELTNTTNIDRDIERALPAASRAIDEMCNRKFSKDATAVSRYFDARTATICLIDDVPDQSVTVAVDRTGNYTYGESWTEGTHYIFEPMNAPADDKPYESMRAIRTSFPLHTGAVKVTARFGWDAVPAQVIEACAILANKLIVRLREAPFGIVSAGIDTGAVMRIARTDPDVVTLLEPFMRNEPLR